MSRVLLAGESWMTTSVHTKGFDSFTTSAYAEGGAGFLAALRADGHEVTYQPSHVAAEQFPDTGPALSAYDLVVLSDIGANTLLLPPSTFLAGHRRPNRLAALAGWVRGGGALLMVGGYLSFQGIEGKANYANTPLADVLPVALEHGDDREERPEGVTPTVVAPSHPSVRGLPGTWPLVLGFQRVTAKPGATVVMTVDGRPLLVAGTAGRGRVIAFTSDMGPHWIPEQFMQWDGYPLMWQRMTRWLCEPPGSDRGSAATSSDPGTVHRPMQQAGTR